jgi:hypothetical protein
MSVGFDKVKDFVSVLRDRHEKAVMLHLRLKLLESHSTIFLEGTHGFQGELVTAHIL